MINYFEPTGTIIYGASKRAFLDASSSASL